VLPCRAFAAYPHSLRSLRYFTVPALPAVPLALDLSAGRQTKTIGRGVIVMRVFVIDVNNMAWTCRVG
jgi:hypothetical protein